MKKYVTVIILAAALVACAMVSCGTELPMENSGAGVSAAVSAESAPAASAEESSAAEESVHESIAPQVSEVISEPEQVSDEPVSEAVSEPVSEESEPVSEPEASVEESSEEISEESSEEVSVAPVARIGEYASPYLETIASGTYKIRISETRTVGGEALPYTVTAYHKDSAVYYEVEESYGTKTSYLRKDGSLIVLDSFSKAAMVYPDDGEQFEKTLWTGEITLAASGSEQLFETEYHYEKYTDDTGFEFTLFFNLADELERYRSYNSSVKDTIVISLSVSPDVSGGVFDIPEGYTVIEG